MIFLNVYCIRTSSLLIYFQRRYLGQEVKKLLGPRFKKYCLSFKNPQGQMNGLCAFNYLVVPPSTQPFRYLNLI